MCVCVRVCVCVQVVSAASNALVQHVGESCWEEGALLSHLWNLHVGLITGGMESANNIAFHAEVEVEQLRGQVKRCVFVCVCVNAV